MPGRKRVTEEDIHVTEALIADSFGRLKKSIVEAPHEAVRPATDMIREHPFLATAGAAGAGVIAFQVLRMMMMPAKGSKGKAGGTAVAGWITQLWPLVAPYVTRLLQQQLSKSLSGERR